MKEKQEKKVNSAELLLWFGVIVLGIIFFLVFYHFADYGRKVRVSINGKKVAEYSLAKDGTYEIFGEENGKNILTIENGAAYMTDADCPDRLCMKQGKIQKVGQSIICLPHKVVVEVVENKKSEMGKLEEESVDGYVK